MHYIFRKSDGVHMATAHRVESVESQMRQTVTNEGGVRDDFVLVEAVEPDDLRGLQPSLSVAGEVVFVPSAYALELEADQTAYLAGTTDQKIDILARRLKILD